MHQLRVCSAVCICISISVYVRGSWISSRNCLSCSWNKTQTRFCLTLNNFPKSRLFANINVFELFDLPKSRLRYTEQVTCYAQYTTPTPTPTRLNCRVESRRRRSPYKNAHTYYVTGAENWKVGHDWRLVRSHRRHDATMSLTWTVPRLQHCTR